MVHFDDFDIVIRPESARGLPHQLEEQIDADAHVVGRDDPAAAFGKFGEFALFRSRERGGADDGRAVVFHREPYRFHHPAGGEVDDGVGMFDQFIKIGGDLHSGLAASGDQSGIFSEERRFDELSGSSQLKFRILHDVCDQPAAHAAGGSNDDDSGHIRSFLMRLHIPIQRPGTARCSFFGTQ